MLPALINVIAANFHRALKNYSSVAGKLSTSPYPFMTEPFWFNDNMGDEDLDLLKIPDYSTSEQPAQAPQQLQPQESQPNVDTNFDRAFAPTPQEMMQRVQQQQLQQQQKQQNTQQQPSQQSMPTSMTPQMLLQSLQQQTQPPQQPQQSQPQQSPPQQQSPTAQQQQNMSKFMSIPPEQRRRFMERQRQYQEGMLKQQKQQMLSQQMQQQPRQARQGPPGPQLQGPPQRASQMPLSQQQQPQQQQQQQQRQNHPQPQPQNMQQQARINQMQQQQQMAKNAEKFLILLQEYMTSRGTPIKDTQPVVAGKNINLLYLYFMVSKLGGFGQVLKSGKVHSVAQNFGLDPANKQSLTELVQLYHKNLFPFEQYAGTPQGMKELALRRQQLMSRPRVGSNSWSQSDTASQGAPTPTAATPLPPQGLPTSHFPTPLAAPSNAGTPGQQVSQPPSSHHSMISMPGTPGIPPTTASATPISAAVQAAPTGPVEHRSFACNYVPHTKLMTKTAGYNLEIMESYGQQLDNLKPVFLYFPELGKVNIHALCQSLESGIDAEINVALNILLVVTSDAKVNILFDSCPELLESLTKIASEIITALERGDYSRQTVATDVSSLPENKSLIDEVFEKYSSKYANSDDQVITVDSLTSKEIDNEESEQMDVDQETPDSDRSDSVLSNTGSLHNSVDSANTSIEERDFALERYMDLLHSCRETSEDFNNGVHIHTYMNRQLMFVEALNTISMIFRNLSFINGPSRFNNTLLATNEAFLDYIFQLIEALGTHPEVFAIPRKRLALLKDTLIIMVNIAHAVELRNDRELFLLMALCDAFGGTSTSADDEAGFLTINIDPMLDKYHSHGVDVLSKIICGSSNNKHIFSDLLNGDSQDNTLISQWLPKFAGTTDLRDGSLVIKLFSYLISAMPLSLLHQGVGPFNAKLPSCLEALLGCITLLDIARDADIKNNIALDILMAPENIGSELVHLAFIYASIYVNSNFETKVQHAYVSSKCSLLVNDLLRDAMDFAKDNGTEKRDYAKLQSLSGFFSNDNNLMGVLMTPNIPQDISLQAVEATKLLNRLRER